LLLLLVVKLNPLQLPCSLFEALVQVGHQRQEEHV
jgi:hypothetical protein